MTLPFLAIINPAAGGGRCRKLVGPALERLRSGGIALETLETSAAGDATRIARDAYARGYRKFLAVGGDGTSYEVVNGLFPDALTTLEEQPTLGFLPLGTGNSFLRDFGDQGVEHAMGALLGGRFINAPSAVADGRNGLEKILLPFWSFNDGSSQEMLDHYYILRQRRFSNSGQVGYWVSILLGLAQLKRRPFPVRVAGASEFDRRPCLFLSFNNSKFTGGTMMIAPEAATDDGLIDFVRWGPIGRAGLVRNLGGLYDGTHVRHRLAESRKTPRVEFDLDGPVDVMVDGEALTVRCEAIDVLPSVLKVVV